MNCSRCESVLSEFMDGKLDAPVQEAVRLHVSGCGECSRLLADIRSLRSTLREFPVAAPPPTLVASILERTTGKPVDRNLWRDFLIPTLRPFLTQRFAFATVMLFIFLSLMVNLAGPPAAAVLSPQRIAESADRMSSEISRRWVEFQDYRTRFVQELWLLKEDLVGRIDFYMITLLFKSYRDAVEEQKENAPQEKVEETAPPVESEQ